MHPVIDFAVMFALAVVEAEPRPWETELMSPRSHEHRRHRRQPTTAAATSTASTTTFIILHHHRRHHHHHDGTMFSFQSFCGLVFLPPNS